MSVRPSVVSDRPQEQEGSESRGRRDVEAVQIKSATKTFGAVEAVSSVDLVIRPRELFTLLGPSGSGKTTLLRMIAGLVPVTSGEIWIGDEEVHARPPDERNIAMVFQSLALFPHLTVAGNIAFPLRMRRWNRRRIEQATRRVLDIVRLPGIEDRMVHELSGGQRQRVAIARAIVYEPQLLLLDEPLGALDRKLREEMQLEIVRLHNELDVTIINVTHDQREALMLSDRIGVMRAGRLEQVGTPQEVYGSPASPFVAEFIGNSNVVNGVIEHRADGDHLVRGPVSVALGEISRGLVGPDATMIVRAEAVRIAEVSSLGVSGRVAFRGHVSLAAFEGDRFYYEVLCEELGTIRATTPAVQGASMFSIGSPVQISWDPADAMVLEG